MQAPSPDDSASCKFLTLVLRARTLIVLFVGGALFVPPLFHSPHTSPHPRVPRTENRPHLAVIVMRARAGM